MPPQHVMRRRATGSSSRRCNRENPLTPDDHPQLVGLAMSERDRRRRAATDPTAPTRPARSSCADTDPAARTTGAAPPPDPAGSSIPRSQPIRSAITVAGIVGNSRQQLPDPRLDRVDHRPRRRPLITRRLIAAQRVAHRVARHPQPTRDRLDAQPLGTMQPPDLSPVLHVDHALPPWLAIEPGFEFHHSKWWTRPEGGQFSTGDRGSVFSRWRHRRLDRPFAHDRLCHPCR